MRQKRRGIERRLGGTPQRRRWIDATEPPDERIGRLRLSEVGLGQDKAIGDGDLLGAFDLTGELVRAVHRVYGGDDVAESEVMAQHGIGLNRRQDGEWIGE